MLFNGLKHWATPVTTLTGVGSYDCIRAVVATGQHFTFFSTIGTNPVAVEFHFFLLLANIKIKGFASTSVKKNIKFYGWFMLFFFFFVNCVTNSIELSPMNEPTDPLLKQALDDAGQSISPILPPGIRNFLIDIDGTICDDVPNEEPERMKHCLPFPDALKTLNEWHQSGHRIYFFTSRTEDLRQITETWLAQHGFKYHGMIMGKPRGGNYHWIDNHMVRATRYEGRFTHLIKKHKSIEIFEEE